MVDVKPDILLFAQLVLGAVITISLLWRGLAPIGSRFSIRDLFVVTTMVATVLGLIAWAANR